MDTGSGSASLKAFDQIYASRRARAVEDETIDVIVIRIWGFETGFASTKYAIPRLSWVGREHQIYRPSPAAGEVKEKLALSPRSIRGVLAIAFLGSVLPSI